MSARTFLIIAAIVLIVSVATSGLSSIRRAPAFLRTVVDILVIAAAVRIGLSVAILAFDSSLASYAIPAAFGLTAAAVLFAMRARDAGRS